MTDKIDDGGPAFQGYYGDYMEPHTGMSLRDWYAGMALQGIIAGCFSGNNQGFTVEGNVTAAYEYADAMLRARGK